MSAASSYARGRCEAAKEEQIRSLTEAISVSCCGRVLSELMNKTKGPGEAATSESSGRLTGWTRRGAAGVAVPHLTTWSTSEINSRR